ncbi:DUF485 domain-containing protein [Helicobacter sp. MIT 01-3238]|uniref:DUF485 domain-containing protein n=1 Tax=Helicobacter sp. MIT 01-3238 TaxID=398627 RepID=UPI000E1E9ACA|nr:DUF485 domain-containing protein [Helicobacter sp. MIT 01-3238]RDU51990.1 DUF485 domain-containing protein [Helicobacter sp. MIT 01-3238]
MRKVASVQDAKARFCKFVSFRNKFCIYLSLVILVCYYAFVASVGFFPEVLGYRLGPSSITLGIMLGIGIIVISIASTGIYTLFANKYFDKEQAQIIEDLQESGALESMIKGESSDKSQEENQKTKGGAK